MADYLAGFYPEWVDKEENPRQIILDLGKMITNRIPVKLGFQKLNKYDPEYWGLATLLTDEQAEVALKMGVRKPKTMADMVKLTGKSEEELEKMLADTEVRLNVDYLADKAALDALAEKVVYTGPVDAYFGYRLGALQYRSVRFETEVLDTDNYQGNAVVNYTDAETPYTRIIEHKHFEFGTQPKTVISREYSAEWKKGDEPYYPVNDEKNGALYAEYKKLADAEPDVIFGGRLGEYKYYDMDKVIEVALDVAAKELK